ncbi:hepcidin-1-like [Garra rufa]|uniref:hepcidin-1-like n=1 Tax=Garra rufa TaxID=137080 RepID=UPI003CCEA422
MKFTRVALAVAVVMACVCFLQTTADTFMPRTKDEHHVEIETLQVNEPLTETAPEQMNPLALLRPLRTFSPRVICTYCCNCCENKGCGYCCE